MMVCYANMNENYEDSVIVNRAAADRGMLSYTAATVHLIASTESMPVPGEIVRTRTHRWWKADCYGKVLSCIRRADGLIRVVVQRQCNLVTGDKVAMQHGQKGVVYLVEPEDMPWGLPPTGTAVQFDMVMAVSSVDNRLIKGQELESMSGLLAARRSEAHTTGHSLRDAMSTCALYDGKTGRRVTRMQDSTTAMNVSATFGIARVWSLNHLIYDKRHYTHEMAGPVNYEVPRGRTRGGGIRLGEMELHAMAAQGMSNSLNELSTRMDLVTTSYCVTCSTLAILCSCGSDASSVHVTVPYSTILATCSMAVVWKKCFKIYI